MEFVFANLDIKELTEFVRLFPLNQNKLSSKHKLLIKTQISTELILIVLPNRIYSVEKDMIMALGFVFAQMV